MVTGVVLVLYPSCELCVELGKGGDLTQVADEELIADGSKEPLDLAFGRAVSNWGVNKDGPKTAADEAHFFGCVVRAVVNVDGFGDTTLEHGGLEAV